MTRVIDHWSVVATSGSRHPCAIPTSAPANTLCPCPPDVSRNLAQHWDRLRAWRQLAERPELLDSADAAQLATFFEWEQHAIAAVDGNCLSHTDLHSLNIVVSQDGARIVDWAWARRAASWVDPAILLLRLMRKATPSSRPSSGPRQFPNGRPPGTPTSRRSPWKCWGSGNTCALPRPYPIASVCRKRLDCGRRTASACCDERYSITSSPNLVLGPGSLPLRALWCVASAGGRDCGSG